MIKKLLLCGVLSLSVLGSVNAFSNALTVSDFIQVIGEVEGDVQEFKVDTCDELPFLQKTLCLEINMRFSNALAKVKPFVGNNELIFRHFSRQKRKLADRYYLKKIEADFRVAGDTGLEISENGLFIRDVLLPHAGTVTFIGRVSGDGDGTYDGAFGLDDDFDIDLDGTFEFRALVGFTANLKILETEDEYIVVAQPVFRILLMDSDVEIDYDIDGLGINATFTSIVDAIGDFVELRFDFLAFDIDDIKDNAVDLVFSASSAFLSAGVGADDALGDELFKQSSDLTEMLLNDFIDANVNRVLLTQENRVNQEITKALDLNGDGVVEYRFPKSRIFGPAVGQLIPAIQNILSSN
ncbi:MAG: hypothetical protein COB04_04315 [Gammaproteobacteria bacterium]|nr:MAG: hypothetical protein COB04_04315 [Gammaproteobacteria bacterium]